MPFRSCQEPGCQLHCNNHRWASLIKKLVSLIVNPLTKKLVPLNDNPLIHNKSNGSYFSPLIVNILHGNEHNENACAFF